MYRERIVHSHKQELDLWGYLKQSKIIKSNEAINNLNISLNIFIKL